MKICVAGQGAFGQKHLDALKDWNYTAVSWLDEIYDLAARFPKKQGLKVTKIEVQPLTPKSAKDKPPAILLEVDGRVYRISKGAVMNGPNNTTLRVMEVTKSDVKIQVSPQNETTVLDTIVLH